MYSMLLPLCCCDQTAASLDRPIDWHRRHAASAHARVRSPATGLLRVSAMALRRPIASGAQHQRWSLV